MKWRRKWNSDHSGYWYEAKVDLFLLLVHYTHGRFWSEILLQEYSLGYRELRCKLFDSAKDAKKFVAQELRRILTKALKELGEK